MSQPKPEVEQFIVSVGRRVDRHRLFDVVFWAMIGGGALMLTIALCYVVWCPRAMALVPGSSDSDGCHRLVR